ncbi:MAG TPA: type II toxin-antitoxin system HicB family antitoxin [Pyrinomonadaceae bacterium]|nr:type II toxin-antitoxin system HicB family antitoxin [Pyrinomonadaceae bacterium]
MNELMEYKGFKAKVEFSADDEVFFGRLIGIDDIVTFEGTTVRELKKAMKDAVEFHIEICERIGQKVKKPYSGKLLFRLPSELHAKIAEVAVKNGKSINEWGREVLETAVQT